MIRRVLVFVLVFAALAAAFPLLFDAPLLPQERSVHAVALPAAAPEEAPYASHTAVAEAPAVDSLRLPVHPALLTPRPAMGASGARW